MNQSPTATYAMSLGLYTVSLLRNTLTILSKDEVVYTLNILEEETVDLKHGVSMTKLLEAFEVSLYFEDEYKEFMRILINQSTSDTEEKRFNFMVNHFGGKVWHH